MSALHSAGVRYLVAGGLAVNAHGYLRFTRDIDIVLQLSRANIQAAFAALAEIGYWPIVPISADEFADAGKRSAWEREKGMTVLNFRSEQYRDMPSALAGRRKQAKRSKPWRCLAREGA